MDMDSKDFEIKPDATYANVTSADIDMDCSSDQTVCDPDYLDENTFDYASDDDDQVDRPHGTIGNVKSSDNVAHERFHAVDSNMINTLDLVGSDVKLIKPELLEGFGYDPIGAGNSGTATSDITISKPKYNNKSATNIVGIQQECASCNKSFSSSNKLREHHLLFHKRDAHNRPYKCAVCNLTFHYYTEIETHVKIHSRQVKLLSCVCGKSFGLATVLRLHMRMNHGRINEHRILSGNEHDIAERKMPSASFTSRFFKCAVCQKDFLSLVNLQKHIFLHEGVRPFCCGLCGLRFMRWNDVISHKNLCNFPTNNRYPLRTGRFWSNIKKTSTRSYECTTCNKHFHRRSSFIDHMRWHTCTLHMCCICAEMLPSAQQLRNHMSRHRDVPKRQAADKYKCNLCDKSYTYSAGLSRHLKSHTRASSTELRKRPGTMRKRQSTRQNCITRTRLQKRTKRQTLGKGISLPKHKKHMPGRRRDNGIEFYQCTVCGSSFELRHKLNSHMRDHHATHPCPVCHMTFPTKYKRDKHRVVHKGEEMFRCIVCNVAFETRYKLETHNASHTGLKPHQCMQCDTSYVTRKGLKCHVVAHHQGGNPFSCEECDEAYKTTNALNKHKAEAHTDLALYRCMECDESFSSAETLRKHIAGHAAVEPHQYELDNVPDNPNGAKLFSCATCDAVFPTKYKLSVHHASHVGAKPHKCEHCDNSYMTKGEVTKHIIAHHQGGYPYICNDCGEGFKNSYALKKHKADIHTGLALYRCLACTESFPNSEKLRKHRVLHTGIDPFQCSVCAKIFPTKQRFMSHKVEHGEEPFKCRLCGETFTKYDHRRKHMAVHTGIDPFTCSFCGESFASNQLRSEHLVVHTGIEPYQCKICDLSFPSRYRLKKHSSFHPSELPQ